MDHSLHGMGSPLNVVDPDKAPKMTMEVDTNQDRTVSVSLQTENLKFAVEEPAVHVDGEGHGHLYLNGLKIQRMYSPSTTIGALQQVSIVSVTINTNDHRFYAVNGERVEASETVSINE